MRKTRARGFLESAHFRLTSGPALLRFTSVHFGSLTAHFGPLLCHTPLLVRALPCVFEQYMYTMNLERFTLFRHATIRRRSQRSRPKDAHAVQHCTCLLTCCRAFLAGTRRQPTEHGWSLQDTRSSPEQTRQEMRGRNQTSPCGRRLAGAVLTLAAVLYACNASPSLRSPNT